MNVERPERPDDDQEEDFEVLERVGDLRLKGYTDEEIADSMSVDEGIEKDRIEKAMKKLDEEAGEAEKKGGDIDLGERDSREE